MDSCIETFPSLTHLEACQSLLILLTICGLLSCRCTVAAGLALRYDSSQNGKDGQAVKEAYWHIYDNIKVNHHSACLKACLTVGHWVPNAPSSGRRDGATKVSIIAAMNSNLWWLKSMWR